MTTADIMLASASSSSGGFAQPGDVKSFRDHDDTRTVLWALLAAIVIHFVMAFLLAAFGGVFSPSLPTPEMPVELTLVDL